MEILKDEIGERGKNLMQLAHTEKESLRGTSLENRGFLIYLHWGRSACKQNRAGNFHLRIHGGVRIQHFIREYPPEAYWSRERDTPREPVTKIIPSQNVSLEKTGPERQTGHGSPIPGSRTTRTMLPSHMTLLTRQQPNSNLSHTHKKARNRKRNTVYRQNKVVKGKSAGKL
jgi:hypothetical protein